MANEKPTLVVPGNTADRIIQKAQDNPSGARSQLFSTERQRNAQFIQKGISKPGRISYDVLRRAASSVHIARICITVLKERVTKTKWVVQPIDPMEKKNKGKVDKRIKEVEELFKHPNKSNETFRTLLDKMLEDLLVLDTVSIEKTRFPDGKLAELHFVDSATIRPVFDEYGNQDLEIPLRKESGDQVTLPVSYVQVLGNSQYGGPESGEIVAAWPKKDFIYFHQHPQGSMEGIGYGLSPIEGVLSVVANLLNADNFNGSYFQEGAFPPIIIQILGQVGQRDIEAYREYLYGELLGNFHRPAIMAGGTDFKVHNLKDLTNRDMEFMEYMKFLARLLAAAYGLSGQDIGLTDDLNKAISETQKDLSEAKGYASILDLLKQVFNQEIIWKDFGYDDLEFEWVVEDTTDPDIQSNIYDKYLRNGTLTMNEIRQKIGETPYPEWADTPMILTGSGYVPISMDMNETAEPENAEIIGGEKPYKEQQKKVTKSIQKSIYTEDGYKTWVADSGYGQPFICYNILSGQGYIIKPPVAVNVTSQKLEEKITAMLNGRGLNVPVVRRMTMVDIKKHILETDLVRIEFDKYVNMTPDYDSEKWRNKFGGSRKFPYYMVSSYVEGLPLNNPLLIQDMKRDPDSYIQAIKDLSALWNVEKEMVLGDRRCDQFIITPDKRAFGIDYQFMGDVQRWEDSKDAIQNTLVQVPSLLKIFMEETNQKASKSMFKKVMEVLSK